jgi:hypothetical protein
MEQLAPIIRDYLRAAKEKRGFDPISNFTVLNALAVCVALPLAGAPDDVVDWFFAAVEQARQDLVVLDG